MAEPILVDNDVILKLCCFGSSRFLVTGLGDLPAAMLAIGRFTLRDRVRRARTIVNKPKVAAALEDTFKAIRLLQPDDDEVALATELEERAAQRALDLDVGESQLLAILIRRAAPLLVTGDKRAIVAIAALGVVEANGRIACFEQAMATLLTTESLDRLREGVCAERAADRAVTACFACTATTVDEDDVRSGLSSYTEHLREASGSVLIGSDDLSEIC